jgi:hypothetical protein
MKTTGTMLPICKLNWSTKNDQKLIRSGKQGLRLMGKPYYRVLSNINIDSQILSNISILTMNQKMMNMLDLIKKMVILIMIEMKKMTRVT